MQNKKNLIKKKFLEYLVNIITFVGKQIKNIHIIKRFFLFYAK